MASPEDPEAPPGVPRSGRLAQQVRVVGLSVLALALVAAAVAVVVGPKEAPAATLEMPAPQTCPPPCVPHVFSAKEEAELAGGQIKGKLTLPGGDSAVEEAMKAATDANGQMTALAPSSNSERTMNQGGSYPFKPARTVRPVVGHGGMPFISQWDQMHGESEGPTHSTSQQRQQAETSSRASVSDSSNPQTRLRASSGTLGGGGNTDDDNNDDDSSRGSSDNTQQSDSSSGDGLAKGASLTTALRSLSNRRLRSIVRLLLKSRAADKGERYGGHGVSLLRSILDGSRKRQEEKRQLEQSELMRVRKAMDELAYKATRRRRESEEDEDAISALTKRLSGYGDNSELRRSRADGDRRGSLKARGGAHLDRLYQLDNSDVRPRHGESSSTERLLQMLGEGGNDRREGDGRYHGRAELHREVGSKMGAATKNLQRSNKAIVEELAQLAARSPTSKH